MLPYIQQNKKKSIAPEAMRRLMAFRIATVLIIGGILTLISIVLSVASCKEELRLEEERKVLQKSRDSLEQHLIIIPPVLPVPASTVDMRDTAPWTSSFIF